MIEFVSEYLIYLSNMKPPILRWLPNYQIKNFSADLIAGFTIWAVMIPEAMAYSDIAGVPAIIGLYSVPLPLLIYSILGTSRTMVVGPDSATALISAVTIGAMATVKSAQYISLTASLALVVGLLFSLFGLLKMGWVANFIPIPVMKGFVQGLIWLTIIGQVPKIFGLDSSRGDFWQKFIHLIRYLPQLHLTTTLVGLLSILLLLLFKRYFPKLPGALLTVIISIAIVRFFHLEQQGVKVISSIATGMPSLKLPFFSLDNLDAMIAGALAIVLVGYAESLGAAKTAAEKFGEEIDANQELISYGISNLASSFSSGFVVVGSLSKTSVAIDGGAISQVSSIVHSLLVILTLLFLMPLFSDLPHATLSAIVIEAMLGLSNLKYLKRLRLISSLEFGIAMASFLAVLFLDVLPGISLGVVLSLLWLLDRATNPGSAILGKLPDEEMYRDIARHPEALTIPGLLIFRFNSSLFFPNANNFRSNLLEAIQNASSPVRQVLIDAETLNFIDVTAIDMLAKLNHYFQQKDIVLSLARVRDPVRDLMQKMGLEREIGSQYFYERISDGLQIFLEKNK